MEEHYEEAGGFIQSSPKREFLNIKTLRNLTISQINAVETLDNSAQFKLDSAEITNIVIIGWVRDIKKVQTGVVFTIDDGTDFLKCTFWSHSSVEEEQTAFINIGNFLKLIGSIRIYEGKKSFHCSYIQQIEDSNYLTYHYINCIYQHLYFSNRLKKESKKINKMPKILEDVLNCIKNNQDEGGLNINIIVRMMESKYPSDAIKDAIKTLLNDCHIHSVGGEDYRTTI
ncbi:hypothetical protein H311_03066 [Anncaliia algerae PRA109]|nr:hypothetical protein H311_03066 [Anncaliia algerae PRA109]